MMNPALLPNQKRMHATAVGAGRVAAATHVVVAACAAFVVAVDTPAQRADRGNGRSGSPWLPGCRPSGWCCSNAATAKHMFI